MKIRLTTTATTTTFIIFVIFNENSVVFVVCIALKMLIFIWLVILINVKNK